MFRLVSVLNHMMDITSHRDLNFTSKKTSKVCVTDVIYQVCDNTKDVHHTVISKTKMIGFKKKILKN